MLHVTSEHRYDRGHAMYSMLGKGVYSFPEAARLTHLKISRVKEWFRGRRKGRGRMPVFASDYESVQGRHAISFLDLVDLFIAGQLRDHGVSLQHLRRVYDRLKADY